MKRIGRRVRAGERLSELAVEYGVNRKTIRRRLDAAALAAAERARQRAAKRAEQKRLQRLERAPRVPTMQARSRAAAAASPPGRGGGEGRVLRSARTHSYADWLNERDARVSLVRAGLHSPNEQAAERAVAAGGGMQALIETTGLRTLENVLALIDPAILDQARQNDAAPAPAPEPAR